jgi:hypothetical protein
VVYDCIVSAILQVYGSTSVVRIANSTGYSSYEDFQLCTGDMLHYFHGVLVHRSQGFIEEGGALKIIFFFEVSLPH